ncbi:unnamed protein product, partial [Didymodactylos carnosus]
MIYHFQVKVTLTLKQKLSSIAAYSQPTHSTINEPIYDFSTLYGGAPQKKLEGESSLSSSAEEQY